MLNVHTLDLQKAEFAQVMNDAKQTCIWGVAQCARFAYSTSSQADMAQLVEHNLAKVGVAGSSPVVRSIWAFSSGGERFPDTEEVTSSNLVTPTKCSQSRGIASGLFCYKHT